MAEKKQYSWGTGRRKTAVARVRVCDGEGQFKVNGRMVHEFFDSERQILEVQSPLRVLDRLKGLDVHCNCRGGGQNGQAGAIVMGLARALSQASPEDFGKLKKAGFLTRDSRMRERKKPGKKGARASYQFSKR